MISMWTNWPLSLPKPIWSFSLFIGRFYQKSLSMPCLPAPQQKKTSASCCEPLSWWFAVFFGHETPPTYIQRFKKKTMKSKGSPHDPIETFGSFPRPAPVRWPMLWRPCSGIRSKARSWKDFSRGGVVVVNGWLVGCLPADFFFVVVDFFPMVFLQCLRWSNSFYLRILGFFFFGAFFLWFLHNMSWTS